VIRSASSLVAERDGLNRTYYEQWFCVTDFFVLRLGLLSRKGIQAPTRPPSRTNGGVFQTEATDLAEVVETNVTGININTNVSEFTHCRFGLQDWFTRQLRRSASARAT
jgi:hypothetical protein